MQDWLNRLGLTLQFVALWFVTPQIVGENLMLRVGERLTAFADRWAAIMNEIGDLADRMQTVLALLFALPLVVAFILWRVWSTGPAHSAGVWLGVVLFSVFWVFVVIYLVARSVGPVMSGLSWLSKTATRSAHRLLIAGAILFTIGYAILLAATWTHA